MYKLQTNFGTVVTDASLDTLSKYNLEYTAAMLADGYRLGQIRFVYSPIQFSSASSIRSMIARLKRKEK